MPRLRAHRLTTTLIVVLALLFSQFALAAYTCPGQQDAAAMEQAMASGMPCEGMDDQQPVLCHQHQAGGIQSAEVAKLPVLPPLAMVLLLQVPLVLQAQQASALPVAAPPQARPPPGPVFLSTLRLRV